METRDQLVEDLNAHVAELARKAHAMGFELTGLTLKKHPQSDAKVDFFGCTTTCDFDENGHLRCRVSCP